MGAQAVGLYPDKYGPGISIGEELVKANIFANRFSMMSGQYLEIFGWLDLWTSLT